MSRRDARDGARDNLGQQTNHMAWLNRLLWVAGMLKPLEEQIQAFSVLSSPQLDPR